MNKLYYRMFFLSIILFNTLIQSMQNNNSINYNMINRIMDSFFFKESLQTFPRYWSIINPIARSLEVDTTCTATEKSFNLNKKTYVKIKELTKEKNKFDDDIKNNDGSTYKMDKNNSIKLKIKLEQLHNKINQILNKIVHQEYFKTIILELFNILVERQGFSEYQSIISINSAKKEHAEKFLATLGLNEKWEIVTQKKAQYFIKKTEDTDMTNEIEGNEKITLKGVVNMLLGEKDTVIKDLENRLDFSEQQIQLVKQELRNQSRARELRDYKTFNLTGTGVNLEKRYTLNVKENNKNNSYLNTFGLYDNDMDKNNSINFKQLYNKIKHIQDKIIHQEYFKTNILEIFNILVKKQTSSQCQSIIRINSVQKEYAEKFLEALGLNEKWEIVTQKKAQYFIKKTEDTDITNEIEGNEKIPVKALADLVLGEKNKIIDDLENRLNFSLKELETLQQKLKLESSINYNSNK